MFASLKRSVGAGESVSVFTQRFALGYYDALRWS